MRGTLATTVLALAIAAGAAHAQTPNPAADAALAEGRRLYDLQEWEKAIAKFKEAYALREDAAALYNIAQSYRLKGDCAQAASFYKTFKRKFPKEKNVDVFIAEMEACTKNTPTLTPTPTTTPTPTPPTTAPTTAPPPEPTVATAPAGTDTAPIEPVDRPSSGSGLRIASYVTMGAGGAGLIVGAVFGVKARSAASEAEDLGMGEQWKPGIQDRGLRNQRAATISLVAGGALVAGGVVMFFLSRPSSNEQGGVTVAPTSDGAQLVWAGSF